MKNILLSATLFLVGATMSLYGQTAPQSAKTSAKTTISADSSNRIKLRFKSYEMKLQSHFPEGDLALFTYIAHNLKYTQADRDKKVHGNVLIRFDVDADSTIKEVRIIRDPCADCGKALVDMFQHLKFVPAQMNNGSTMRSNMMMEIPVWAH